MQSVYYSGHCFNVGIPIRKENADISQVIRSLRVNFCFIHEWRRYFQNKTDSSELLDADRSGMSEVGVSLEETKVRKVLFDVIRDRSWMDLIEERGQASTSTCCSGCS